MSREARDFEDLEHIRELNRLFLSFLHTRAHERLDCLGLNATTIATLRSASTDTLDRLADFPGALFRLKFDALRPRVAGANLFQVDPAQLSLQSGILNGVWHLVRRSSYSARLYLAMSDAEVRLLRSMPLLDLSRLALSVDLIDCAFRESEWVWIELLTETRPEYRRCLLLAGMQPNLGANCRLGQPSQRASH